MSNPLVQLLFANSPTFPEQIVHEEVSYSISVQGKLETDELSRALEQAWDWKEAASEVGKHQAAVTIQAEGPTSLEAMSHLCAFVMSQLNDDTIAVFFPRGERLWEPTAFVECSENDELMPSELWTSVRLFNLPQEKWKLMDTIGSVQVGRPDHMIWRPADVNAAAAAAFLLDLSYHNLKENLLYEAGHTIVGPDDARWFVKRVGLSPTAPQREIVVWAPKATRLPPELASA